ncbi:hypothetical protein B0H11DRAFT_2079799 [Mycena galericulata]|nr:hypothetical protein B0H11DRAFT_2079799 [Mycena galericulata]
MASSSSDLFVILATNLPMHQAAAQALLGALQVLNAAAKMICVGDSTRHHLSTGSIPGGCVSCISTRVLGRVRHHTPGDAHSAL